MPHRDDYSGALKASRVAQWKTNRLDVNLLRPVLEVIKLAGRHRLLDFISTGMIFGHLQTNSRFPIVVVLLKIGLVILTVLDIAPNEFVDDQILKKYAFHVMQVDLIFPHRC